MTAAYFADRITNASRQNEASAPGRLSSYQADPARDGFWMHVESIAGGVSLGLIGYAMFVFAGGMQ
jgi:hypothetical protein